MNFSTVEQNNGSLVDMFGTFVEIGGVQYTQNQKEKSVCKIADDSGVTHKVHLHKGNGQLPQPNMLQQRHAFSLKTFQGTYQNSAYTGYSGFWKDRIQVNQPSQPQQSALPQPQQAPQQAAQGTKQGRNGREVSIERQAAFKAACDAWDTATPEDIIKLAISGHYFIETGKNFYEIPEPDPSIQSNPDYVGDNPPPPVDSEVPF